jgi:hypothetical protein
MSAPSRISLKNIKHAAFASHETHCFEATVCLDGDRVCKVENDGKGGSDHYYPYKGQSNESFNIMIVKLREACADQLKVEDPETYEQFVVRKVNVTDGETGNSETVTLRNEINYNLASDTCIEIVVCNTLNTSLIKKDIKRLMRAKVQLIEVSSGKIYEIKSKPLPETIERVKKQYEPEYLVLNTLSEEEQFYHWTKTTEA